MSLISIAQRETFHISFVQAANKSYEADCLTPGSYKITALIIVYLGIIAKHFQERKCFLLCEKVIRSD